ncbi:MAG: substrate-binding domain-containing protein, partial [Anaerolineales bacterium]|nr:substrate-binding domain-containing protein [Anaerolineales bacterium]
EALQAADIPYNPDYQIEGDRGRISARAMAKHLLSMPSPPTAIFAASDTQAIGILDVAGEMGLHIPGDLSVIGYDDIRDAEYMSLTTIDQHLDRSGIEGATLLLELLAESNSKVPCNQIIAVDLVVRETTGPPLSS